MVHYINAHLDGHESLLKAHTSSTHPSLARTTTAARLHRFSHLVRVVYRCRHFVTRNATPRSPETYTNFQNVNTHRAAD